jgi:hypothetical protein
MVSVSKFEYIPDNLEFEALDVELTADIPITPITENLNRSPASIRIESGLRRRSDGIRLLAVKVSALTRLSAPIIFHDIQSKYRIACLNRTE